MPEFKANPSQETNTTTPDVKSVRDSLLDQDMHANHEPHSAPTTVPQTADRDYVSPGFRVVHPDEHFPSMVVGNKQNCNWPYLRREVPHKWYADIRLSSIGFANRDEAHILYNTALQFKGRRALEIGCWMGWSACHLLLAGVKLDVVDPLLGTPEIRQSVENSLRSANVFESANLITGKSPAVVNRLANVNKWNLFFIDGNHSAPAPLNDAIACESVAHNDALILFHDLVSPDVAQGLAYYRNKGWNTLIYQTMQIMGVAWRGNVAPVQHVPDPSVAWTLPRHLDDFTISGKLE